MLGIALWKYNKFNEALYYFDEVLLIDILNIYSKVFKLHLKFFSNFISYWLPRKIGFILNRKGFFNEGKIYQENFKNEAMKLNPKTSEEWNY